MSSRNQHSHGDRQERPRIGKPQQQGSQQNIKPGSLKSLDELRRERGDDWDPLGKRRESGVFSKVIAFFRGENENESEHGPSSKNRRSRSASASSGSKGVRLKALPIRVFERLIEPFLQNEKSGYPERRYSDKSHKSRSSRRPRSQGDRYPTAPLQEVDHRRRRKSGDKAPQTSEVRARPRSLPRRKTYEGVSASDIRRKPLHYNAAENKYEDLDVKNSNALRQDQVEVRNNPMSRHRSVHGYIGVVSNNSSAGNDGRSKNEHNTPSSRDADTSRSKHRRSKAAEVSERKDRRQTGEHLKNTEHAQPGNYVPPPKGYTYDEPSKYSQIGRTKSFYGDDRWPQGNQSHRGLPPPPMKTVWNEYETASSNPYHNVRRRGGNDKVSHAATDKSGWTYDWATGRNIFSQLPPHDVGSPLTEANSQTRNNMSRDTLDQIYVAYAESKTYLTAEIEKSTTVDEASERRAELARLEGMMNDFLERFVQE